MISCVTDRVYNNVLPNGQPNENEAVPSSNIIAVQSLSGSKSDPFSQESELSITPKMFKLLYQPLPAPLHLSALIILRDSQRLGKGKL